MVILYGLYTCIATATGTTGAEGLNTDQIIGISVGLVGLVGAAATIIGGIIATCKCCLCKFTVSSLASIQIVLVVCTLSNKLSIVY